MFDIDTKTIKHQRKTSSPAHPKMLTTALSLALLATSCSAASASYPRINGAASCHQFMIPVPVSATNTRFTAPTVDSSMEAADWAIEDSRRTNVNRSIGDIAINQTFSIAAELCIPRNGAKKHHLQILTHGQFANRNYWYVTLLLSPSALNRELTEPLQGRANPARRVLSSRGHGGRGLHRP